jgi:two-component system, response regulator PdtaR
MRTTYWGTKSQMSLEPNYRWNCRLRSRRARFCFSEIITVQRWESSKCNIDGTNAVSPALVGQEYLVTAILIVEDEPLLCLNLSEVLRSEGYDVIATTNADEAIEVLQSRTDIRTIFTDINMPGSMNGLKLAAVVRDRWPPVNIIVTTGMRAPHSDELPAHALFIAKPYHHRNVLEAVRSFGESS